MKERRDEDGYLHPRLVTDALRWRDRLDLYDHADPDVLRHARATLDALSTIVNDPPSPDPPTTSAYARLLWRRAHDRQSVALRLHDALRDALARHVPPR